jgi:peptidoglycan hydrolase CwlO-like protein
MKLIADIIIYISKKLAKCIFMLIISICIFSAYQEIKSQIEDENNRQNAIEINKKKFEKALNSLDNGIKYWKKEVKKQKA